MLTQTEKSNSLTPMRNVKTIKFYRKNVYGETLEYIADKGDAAIVTRLTGKKTINGITRELIRDLTGGAVGFEEVIAP